MEPHLLALYQLAQEVGRTEFLAALELAHGQQTFGVEYVRAILVQPQPRPAPAASDLARQLPAALAVSQPSVARELADYEQYVANRTQVGGAR
jgi:hypothetical protein